MTLYEMTETAKYLLELLTADEIDEQTVVDTMESIGAEEKVEAYCKIIKTLEAENDAIANEEKRLKAVKIRNKNSIDRMKNGLLAFLDASGEKTVKGGTFTVGKRKSTAINILDENALDVAYLTVKTEPNKTAIKEAIESGVDLSGIAEIVEKFSTTIK